MTNTNDHTDLGYSVDALAQRKSKLLDLLSQTAPEVMGDYQQININKLKELLGQEHIAGDEHYELTWAGKAAARREIQKSTSHTLLPDAGNPIKAQHILVEGENLEVLRVLQKSYYGKVKMIYIDPPYNTGNDSFVYPDDYSETLEEYQKRTGEKNEAGYLNKQSLWKKNSKESGQYHSAWLSMMYPRLYLARNLLSDDGVIFISIDDNEVADLIHLTSEIFGAENHLATLIWRNGRTASSHFTIEHEYIIAFAKNKANLDFFEFYGEELISDRTIKKIGVKNPASEIIFKAGIRFECENKIFPNEFGDSEKVVVTKGVFECKDGKLANDVVIKAGWAMKDMIEAWLSGSEVFDQKGQRIESFYFKSNGVLQYEKAKGTIHPKSIFEGCTTKSGTADLGKVISNSVFDYPKPVDLIKQLISISTKNNDLVCDFFAGRVTTAQALIESNLEDGGTRQFICLQMPEVLDVQSEAYKAGYRTIADITRDRIDKVIAKLKTEQPDKTSDLACAYFTLAPSNFKVWHSDISDENALRDQLALFQSAEKGGRTSKVVDTQIAMLTELLLKHGLGALGVHAISEPKLIAGTTVYRVLLQDDRRMWLYFGLYTESLKDEIVKARPAQVILLNSCFVGDKADELLSNLQLELQGLDIGLTVI